MVKHRIGERVVFCWGCCKTNLTKKHLCMATWLTFAKTDEQKKQFSEATATASSTTTRTTAPMVTWQNILKLWKSHFQNFWTFIINCLVFIKHKMRIIPELQFHNCGVHYKTFLITILVQRLWSHLEGYRLYITSQVSVPVEACSDTGVVFGHTNS